MTDFNMPFSEILNLLSEQVAQKILHNLNASNSASEDTFLNIEEAAQLIQLSKPTVYGLVHKNKIPYHKKGKRLYFLKSEILAWLKSGKQDTKSDLLERADAYLSKNKLF